MLRKVLLFVLTLMLLSGCNGAEMTPKVENTFNNIKSGAVNLLTGTEKIMVKNNGGEASESNIDNRLDSDLRCYYSSFVNQKGIENLTEQEILYSLRFSSNKDNINNERFNLDTPLKRKAALIKQKEFIKTMKSTDVCKFSGSINGLYKIANYDIDKQIITLRTNFIGLSDIITDNFGQMSAHVFSTSDYSIHLKEVTQLLTTKIPFDLALKIEKNRKDFDFIYDIEIDNKSITFVEEKKAYQSHLSLNAKLSTLKVMYNNTLIASFNEKDLSQKYAIFDNLFFNTVSIDIDSDIMRDIQSSKNFNREYLDTTEQVKINGVQTRQNVNAKGLSPQNFCNKIAGRSITLEEIKSLYNMDELKRFEKNFSSIPFDNNGQTNYFGFSSSDVVKSSVNTSPPICVKKKTDTIKKTVSTNQSISHIYSN